MTWKFVIPNPSAFPSGGNVYNRQITDALIQLSEKVHIVQPENLSSNTSESHIYIWDTIFLSEMKSLEIQKMPGHHIMLVHHLASMYPGPEVLFDQQEKLLIDQMDTLWVTSEFAKTYLKERGIKTPTLVMPPIFNGPKFEETSYSVAPKLLIAANLVERKGVFDFLKLLDKKKSLPAFQLNVSGSHNLEPEYAHKCIKLVENSQKLESVHFLGPIPQENVFELYHSSDLYISTSYFETFGMSIQEALYYNTPVLGMDGGNTSYLIKGSGWCVQNMQELVDQLFYLLVHPESIRRQPVHFQNWKPNWVEAARYLIQMIKP